MFLDRSFEDASALFLLQKLCLLRCRAACTLTTSVSRCVNIFNHDVRLHVGSGKSTPCLQVLMFVHETLNQSCMGANTAKVVLKPGACLGSVFDASFHPCMPAHELKATLLHAVRLLRPCHLAPSQTDTSTFAPESVCRSVSISRPCCRVRLLRAQTARACPQRTFSMRYFCFNGGCVCKGPHLRAPSTLKLARPRREAVGLR